MARKIDFRHQPVWASRCALSIITIDSHRAQSPGRALTSRSPIFLSDSASHRQFGEHEHQDTAVARGIFTWSWIPKKPSDSLLPWNEKKSSERRRRRSGARWMKNRWKSFSSPTTANLCIVREFHTKSLINAMKNLTNLRLWSENYTTDNWMSKSRLATAPRRPRKAVRDAFNSPQLSLVTRTNWIAVAALPFYIADQLPKRVSGVVFLHIRHRHYQSAKMTVYDECWAVTKHQHFALWMFRLRTAPIA